MILESSNFPLVWLSRHEGDPGEGFAEFEALLVRRQAFVLLSRDDESEHEDTQEERKQTVLWMKKHKEVLRLHVNGMVQIEPRAEKRQAAQNFIPIFTKA